MNKKEYEHVILMEPKPVVELLTRFEYHRIATVLLFIFSSILAMSFLIFMNSYLGHFDLMRFRLQRGHFLVLAALPFLIETTSFDLYHIFSTNIRPCFKPTK